MKPPTIWLIDGPTLLLYIAAAVAVFVLREVNDRAYSAPAKDAPMPPSVVVLITLVSNLLVVASLVLLANALSSATRLSMLALPLLLLLERYGRIMSGQPAKRKVSAFALAGSVAGLAIGAWVFMRKAIEEPIKSTVLPGDIQTIPAADALQGKANWAVSIDLIAFYLVSVTIFVGLHSLLQRISKLMMNGPKEELKKRAAAAAIVSFVLNFMGVVALVLIAKRYDVQLRLAMVGFPLFLIAESYASVLRSDPENRPSNWTGLIGSGTGMIVATFFLLRGAPLH